jgi:hypothetical protein
MVFSSQLSEVAFDIVISDASPDFNDLATGSVGHPDGNFATDDVAEILIETIGDRLKSDLLIETIGKTYGGATRGLR